MTPFHPIPCSMLDREAVSEAVAFFLEKREVSRHFACLARGQAKRLLGFCALAGGPATIRARRGLRFSGEFAGVRATARTKRRVIASMSRFCFGLPWS